MIGTLRWIIYATGLKGEIIDACQMDLQAIGRVHRLGQTRPVLVLRLVSEGLDYQTPSAEQELLHTANKKLQAEKEVLVSVLLSHQIIIITSRRRPGNLTWASRRILLRQEFMK